MDRAEAATLRPFASALLLSYSPKCVEKLFGKSGWVPNRGSESGQEGSKESRSAISLAARSTAETPLAIFQTVSEGEFSEVRVERRPGPRCFLHFGAVVRFAPFKRCAELPPMRP